MRLLPQLELVLVVRLRWLMLRVLLVRAALGAVTASAGLAVGVRCGDAPHPDRFMLLVR
ncbi:hypothetical protein L3Q67_02485 [Saccharothrix sp. AJ9571]|nr:hypothetical protein L3Q67_02485 [Saccharothrix sp. AJ9571]